MKLDSFKALVFDIDNTLVNSDKKIPAEVKLALQQLSEKGYYLAACSGKSYPALKNTILPVFGPESLHITTGGSQITSSTGEVVWEKVIPTEIVTSLIENLERLKAHYFVIENQTIFSSSNLIDYLKKHPFNLPVEIIPTNFSQPTPSITIYYLDDEIENLLNSYGSLIFHTISGNKQGKSVVDVTLPGVNKGLAFQKWSELKNIQPTEVIGFGDSHNDLEFLSLCGWSVAMGNAVEAVKKEATVTIDHVDNNGLGMYLKKCIETNTL